MVSIASPVPNLDDELSIPALVQLYKRRRRLIIGCAITLAVIAAGVALMRPRAYRSSASFAPRAGKSSAGAVSGLAAQFGIAVPGGDPADSPQFYADLVRTRTILDTLLARPYAVGAQAGGRAPSFAQVLAPKSSGEQQKIDAREVLSRRIATDVNQKTNVVTVSVDATDADLAKALATELLHAVNAFALEGRQSRAHQERVFTEARAEEARKQLADAEGELESFLESNRAAGAPRLEFAQERLRRVVATRQALYTALAQAVDQSRIEEMRDTPSLTILDEPELPLKPQSRGLLTLPLLGLVFGAVFGFFLAFAADMLMRDRAVTDVTPDGAVDAFG